MFQLLFQLVVFKKEKGNGYILMLCSILLLEFYPETLRFVLEIPGYRLLLQCSLSDALKNLQ